MLRTRSSLVQRLRPSGPLRYLVVGGFCFAFDLLLLWLAHEVLGIAILIATPIAFLCSFAATYLAQRLMTFRSDARVVPSMSRYTALVIVNTVATTVIVGAIGTLGGSWLLAKVVAVVMTTTWNYLAYKHWVFAPRLGSVGA